MHNSTLIARKKICVSCNTEQYIFSKGRCKQCSTVQDTAKRISAHEQETDTESIQNVIEDLDLVFSRYNRLKYADKDGMLYCYTSGRHLHWTVAQNGHYISRANMATRWMEDNCRPQSEHDNCFLHGNLKMFAEKLEIEKPGITEYLYEQSKTISKPTLSELKELLSIYREKLKTVKIKLI